MLMRISQYIVYKMFKIGRNDINDQRCVDTNEFRTFPKAYCKVYRTVKYRLTLFVHIDVLSSNRYYRGTLEPRINSESRSILRYGGRRSNIPWILFVFCEQERTLNDGKSGRCVSVH